MGIIDTLACEFGYEIIMVVPYANHLAANERGVHFGGRLGSCRYMNMDTTIRQAMDFCQNITHRKP
jgi:UDP-galactopyranose mutase